jgi:hypothetical protein
MQVADDALLALVPPAIGRRGPARAARWIDVRHLGTRIRQQHRRQRARDVLAEVDHTDAAQRGRPAFYLDDGNTSWPT